MRAVEQIIIGMGAGVIFGVVGFFAKREKTEGTYEPWKWRKLFRTVVIYGAAGALVASYGEPVTHGRVEMATASTVIIGELFDKVYPKLRDQALVLWSTYGG